MYKQFGKEFQSHKKTVKHDLLIFTQITKTKYNRHSFIIIWSRQAVIYIKLIAQLFITEGLSYLYSYI